MNPFSFSVACILSLGVCLQTVRAETWTDSTGKHNVEARFVQIADGKVQLQKTDGSIITLPLNRLSAQSQQMALNMAQKAVRPAAAMSAEETLKTLEAAFLNGEPQVIWGLLPEEFQEDLNQNLHSFAAKMDPVVWKDVMEVVEAAASMLKKQKTFIMEHPKISTGIKDPQGFPKTFDDFVSALELLAGSNLADLQKMKQMDIGVFLSTSGKDIVGKMSSVFVKLNSQLDFPPAKTESAAGDFLLRKIEITTVKQNAEKATIRFRSPGVNGAEDKIEYQNYVKYKGKWIAKGWVNQWDLDMKLRAKLIDNLAKSLPAQQKQIATIMKHLKQLEAANTQDEFDAAFMQAILAMVAMSQAASGA